MKVFSAARTADRIVTAVLVGAGVLWSGMYAVVGPLLLRPVSTCGGPEYRCTGLVDLGVGFASWGPAVACGIMLLAVALSARRGRATAPAAGIGVLVIIGLQAIGQALVPLAIVAR